MPGTGEKSRGHRISKKAWVLPSWVLASSAGDRFEDKLHQHTKVHIRGLYQQSSDSEFKLPLQGHESDARWGTKIPQDFWSGKNKNKLPWGL